MSSLRKIEGWAEWQNLWQEFWERGLEQSLGSLIFHLPDTVNYNCDIYSHQMYYPDEHETSAYFEALNFLLGLIRGAHDSDNLYCNLSDQIVQQANTSLLSMTSSGYCHGGRHRFITTANSSLWLKNGHYIDFICRSISYLGKPWVYSSKEPVCSRSRDLLRSSLATILAPGKGQQNLFQMLLENEGYTSHVPHEFRDLTVDQPHSLLVCQALVNLEMFDDLELNPSEIGFQTLRTARDINWIRHGSPMKWVKPGSSFWRLGMDFLELHRRMLAVGFKLEKSAHQMAYPQSTLATI